MENTKIKTGIAIFGVVVPLLISFAGGYISNQLTLARMDERIAVIKENNARHELERGQDIQRLLASRDDHAQRIIRLETSLDTIQVLLSEMKADIKAILKDGK